jgi:hypothetical protein
MPRPRVGAPIDPVTNRPSDDVRTATPLPAEAPPSVAAAGPPERIDVTAKRPVSAPEDRPLLGDDPVTAAPLARMVETAEHRDDGIASVLPSAARAHSAPDESTPPEGGEAPVEVGTLGTPGASSTPIGTPVPVQPRRVADAAAPTPRVAGTTAPHHPPRRLPERIPPDPAPAVQRVIAGGRVQDHHGPVEARTERTPTIAASWSLPARPESATAPASVPRRAGLLGERPVQPTLTSTLTSTTTPASSPGDTVAVPVPVEPVQRAVAPPSRPPVAPATIRDAVAVGTSRVAAPSRQTTTATTISAPVEHVQETIELAQQLGLDTTPVQRQPTDEPAAGPDESVGTTDTTTRSETTSVGPAAPGGEGPRRPSDAEVQEMLQALYPSLRRRLSRDLLLDRERLGYRTDIRF